MVLAAVSEGVTWRSMVHVTVPRLAGGAHHGGGVPAEGGGYVADGRGPGGAGMLLAVKEQPAESVSTPLGGGEGKSTPLTPLTPPTPLTRMSRV